MLRLFRRATASLVDSSETETVQHIWLSFAQASAGYGSSLQETRSLLHHLQPTVEHMAGFYVAQAMVEQKEGNLHAARDYLNKGVASGARPTTELTVAMQTLEGTASPKHQSTPHSATRPLMSSSANRLAKKRKLTDADGSSKKAGDSIRFRLEPSSRATATPPSKNGVVPKHHKTPLQDRHISECKSIGKSKTSTPRTGSRLTITSTRVSVLSSQKNSQRPPRLLASRGGGALGKPVRVDPLQASFQDDDDDDEELSDSEAACTTAELALLEEKPKKPTMKKDEIDYIWAWDPSKPRRQSSNSNDASVQPTTTVNQSHTSSTGSHTGSVEATASTSSRSETSTKTPSDGKCDTLGQVNDDCHPEFQHLTCEKNILRVHDTPYMKLGVLGKGGSCKVYRALSTDCSVVAIKKVKIEGMDQKAIDGYSNEIALLRRLRGNPSIIQLYDSQVDMERNAIFLVMEAGETDLNYLLQRSKKADRSLSLNFIRLTWEQMLLSVHSIHEERIIHGDLKPANFLMVRGALKLIDFGIAKAIQSDDTTNIYRETQIGTLNYMSPEAIQADSSAALKGSRLKQGRVRIGVPLDLYPLGVCILH